MGDMGNGKSSGPGADPKTTSKQKQGKSLGKSFDPLDSGVDFFKMEGTVLHEHGEDETRTVEGAAATTTKITQTGNTKTVPNTTQLPGNNTTSKGPNTTQPGNTKTVPNTTQLPGNNTSKKGPTPTEEDDLFSTKILEQVEEEE